MIQFNHCGWAAAWENHTWKGLQGTWYKRSPVGDFFFGEELLIFYLFASEKVFFVEVSS